MIYKITALIILALCLIACAEPPRSAPPDVQFDENEILIAGDIP